MPVQSHYNQICDNFNVFRTANPQRVHTPSTIMCVDDQIKLF